VRGELEHAQRPFLPFLLSFSAHFPRNPLNGHAFGQSRCAPRRSANGPASRAIIPIHALRVKSVRVPHLSKSSRPEAAWAYFYRRSLEKSAKKSPEFDILGTTVRWYGPCET